MKLKCELQTVYRTGSGATQPSRKSQGLLVLSGRMPELLVTAYTPRNNRGLRYQVASQARVFTRHAAAGKTTRTSGEYVRAFPPGLQQLTAAGIRLRRVEDRLLRLSQQRSLDLSDNRLARLPAIDRRLPQLCELRLAGNQLETLEPLSDRPAGSRLAYLDVSGDRLAALPDTLAFLSKLHFLNVANSQLAALPDADNAAADGRLTEPIEQQRGGLSGEGAGGATCGTAPCQRAATDGADGTRRRPPRGSGRSPRGVRQCSTGSWRVCGLPLYRRRRQLQLLRVAAVCRLCRHVRPLRGSLLQTLPRCSIRATR